MLGALRDASFCAIHIYRAMAHTRTTKHKTFDLFTANRETSDKELDEWGRANIPGFLGVRARSQYPSLYPGDKPMAPGSSCVLNLDYGDYARGGTHWVGVRVSSVAPIVEYFDAFGLPPPREVTNRARQSGLGIVYPDVRYQQYDEVNCGPRAVAVLHYLAHAKNDADAFREISQC